MPASEDLIKHRIEEERRRVTGQIEAFKQGPNPIEDDSERFARLGLLLERAFALDDALHHLEHGMYGTCLACGERIPTERLLVAPEAAFCWQCHEKLRQVRPKSATCAVRSLNKETRGQRARQSGSCPRSVA